MKTKIYIVALIIIFCYSFSYAQLIQLTPTTEMVNNYAKTIPYIFEGTIIQQTHRSSGMLSICSTIQITKIYKGSPQLKLGTIKVLSDGGGDDSGPGLVKGCKYIIFGKPANSKTFDDIITDNGFVLWNYDQINFFGDVYWELNVNNYWLPKQFDSIRARYNVKKDSGIISFQDPLSRRYRIFEFLKRPAAKWSAGKFPTLDSLYSFLKGGGLTVQEEQK